MKDPRITKMAENLISYSLDVQAGENVCIALHGEGEPLAIELVRKLYERGAHPYVKIFQPRLQREWLRGLTEEQIVQHFRFEQEMWYGMHAYIGIHGMTNDAELSDVPVEKQRLYGQAFEQIAHYIDNKTKGIRIHYPTASFAQKANMSTEAFEDFYYQVCSLDYRKLEEACQPLYEWMDRTDKVHIIGPGTDLVFSIRGVETQIAAGKRNIPDGEVYTAPVRHSINGRISYNVPSQYKGTSFERISFTIQEGKIVETAANDTFKLNEILDTDEGARYIGEFAIGVNPYILHPMNDILFDEKIAGSFHLTPGRAYEHADNGNRSLIHWDLISIQRADYGGGEIWFDDVLIRKDGLFVPEALQELNPIKW
ncbi:aminopeptidase [Brevibacillus ruminantium]|uniref:Aminopeptidase n=1 Tax=Brevibacillus ruminantium TaxID=2950604 RepID=A0ABY4WAX4_9BACL|nr:aminopeptidase [Brevibacillus ruminantium]USG64332.1 aminopeptidase [Brevibacillus ruminantium]